LKSARRDASLSETRRLSSWGRGGRKKSEPQCWGAHLGGTDELRLCRQTMEGRNGE
jgi:hypothetical protein